MFLEILIKLFGNQKSRLETETDLFLYSFYE